MGRYSIPKGEWKRLQQAGILAAERARKEEEEAEVPENIFQGIDQDNLHGIKVLLKHEPGTVKQKDEEGRTPLLRAVIAEADDIAKYLVSKGASLTDRTKKGETPLLLAARKGNLDLARVFVSKDADVKASEKEKGESVLHCAAESGNADLVKLLLSKGADPNGKRKSDGWTPLHVAAFQGHFDTVKLLVEKGAKVSAKTKDGLTPEAAAEQGSGPDKKKIVEFLQTAM